MPIEVAIGPIGLQMAQVKEETQRDRHVSWRRRILGERPESVAMLEAKFAFQRIE